MKHFIITLLLAAVITLFACPGLSQSSATKPSISDTAFNSFFIKWENAYNSFINGDPGPWKAICSQSNDHSILGGFGGYEKGWIEAGPRYNWAAQQFKESGARVAIDYISVVVTENMAYVILIERANTKIANAKEPTKHVLRSTQIFRKENREWKLLHRHADFQVEKNVNAGVE